MVRQDQYWLFMLSGKRPAFANGYMLSWQKEIKKHKVQSARYQYGIQAGFSYHLAIPSGSWGSPNGPQVVLLF